MGFFDNLKPGEWETAFLAAQAEQLGTPSQKPSQKPVASNTTSGHTYTVQPGDSYFGLVQKWKDEFGITISPVDLLRLNNLSMQTAQGQAGWLNVGQTINIPSNIWNAINTPAETDPTPTPEPEPEPEPTPAPAPDPDPTPITDTTPDPVPDEYMPIESVPVDAVPDLASDPAYQAFYAQYLLNIDDINTLRDQQGLALFGAMERNFGLYTGNDPYAMEARSGGQYDVLQDRALEDSRNRFAGRGMHYSGGTLRASDDIMTDYAAQKASTWAEYMAQKDEADAAQTQQTRALEMQRLEQERLARERIAAEEARGVYG